MESAFLAVPDTTHHHKTTLLSKLSINTSPTSRAQAEGCEEMPWPPSSIPSEHILAEPCSLVP